VTEMTGMNIVIENISGGGGSIGTQRVARATPDGNTLLVGTISTHVIIPLTVKTPSFDPIKDFTPISNMSIVPNVLVVTKDFPANNLKELIAVLKANPGKYSYGTSGIGSTLHLSGELFKIMAGVDIIHIPYRGGGPAMTDLIGGQIPMMFDVLTGAASNIQANTVKAIAICTKTRSPAFPNLPTMHEAGVPDFEGYTWNGIFAPPGLNPDMAKALTAAFVKAVNEPDIKQKFADLSAVPVGSTAAELQSFVEQQLKAIKPIVDKAGLKQL
jgi:tripartite-type tricarboxylate transporter receptor subunit TctC